MVCYPRLTCPLCQDVGYQHGKLLFTGWARGDIIDNMLKDHRSADYNDSKTKTDVSHSHTHTRHKPYIQHLTAAPLYINTQFHFYNVIITVFTL